MARQTKISQKPSTKIGGGDYFDGNMYYASAGADARNIGELLNGRPVTKAEYEKALAAREEKLKQYDAIAAEYYAIGQLPWGQQEAAMAAFERKYPGAITETTVDTEWGADRVRTLVGPDDYAGGAGRVEKANKVAQMEIPTYELEGKVDIRPQAIEARREGYSDRTQGKIGLLGSKTNRAIADMNKAKQDHINTVTSVNQQIGKPEPGAYKGWTPNSVNQSIAYAEDKAEAGKKSAEKHFANAKSYAETVKASAEAQSAALQKQFDAAGGQVNQATRLQSIVAHLAKRDVQGADSAKAMQRTQGLINSGPSVLNNQSVMAGNSISAMLKPQEQQA